MHATSSIRQERRPAPSSHQPVPARCRRLPRGRVRARAGCPGCRGRGDPLVRGISLPVDAVGVDLQQDRHAAPGPAGDLGRAPLSSAAAPRRRAAGHTGADRAATGTARGSGPSSWPRSILRCRPSRRPASNGSTVQAAVCPPRDRRRWLAIHRADAEIAEDGVGRGFDARADRSLSNGEHLLSGFHGAAYSAAAVNQARFWRGFEAAQNGPGHPCRQTG
jgi:hypothetical protein